LDAETRSILRRTYWNPEGLPMDKKMRKVTKKIRAAESTLKKAEKENTRLANYDERVRDPQIKKAKRCKC
jgi:hypothetical protein